MLCTFSLNYFQQFKINGVLCCMNPRQLFAIISCCLILFMLGQRAISYLFKDLGRTNITIHINFLCIHIQMLSEVVHMYLDVIRSSTYVLRIRLDCSSNRKDEISCITTQGKATQRFQQTDSLRVDFCQPQCISMGGELKDRISLRIFLSYCSDFTRKQQRRM